MKRREQPELRSAETTTDGGGAVLGEQAPLRTNRQFNLLWIGGALSQLGTELSRIAMPLLVLALTGSPGYAGLVAGVRTAAFLILQVPAGVLVDRWDRRRTLVLSQGAQMVNSAALASLVVLGRAGVWVFMVFAAVDGITSALGGPARTVAIRSVVPPEQLRPAYAREEARAHAARLAGPPLGGLLYGISRGLPFVAEAVSFVLVFVCSAAAKVPRFPNRAQAEGDEQAPAPKKRMHQEAGEAFGWLWRQAGLRELSFAAMALNLLGSAYIIPLIVMVGERGGNSLNTGTVLAGIGIGGLIGALTSNRLGGLLPPGRLIIAVLGLFGASLLLMTLPFGSWWPMVPLALISLSTPALNVVMNVVLSRMTPDDMLGRVDAVLTLAQRGLSPLAPVLGGLLAAWFGGAVAIVVIGCALLGAVVLAWSSRALRSYTGEAEPAEQP